MNEIKGAKDDHSHIAIYPATFIKFRNLRGGKDPEGDFPSDDAFLNKLMRLWEWYHNRYLPNRNKVSA
jgi:hypothetical protein